MSHRNHSNVMAGQINIASSWSTERKYKDAKYQTDAVASQQDETQTLLSAFQTTETVDQQVETEHKQRIPPSRPAGSTWIYPGDHFDDESVCAFLKEEEHDLVQELIHNTKSSAFDSYEPNWKPKKDNLGLAMTFTPAFALEREWHVTGLSWNANGSLLAACYGQVDSVAWCQNKGYACVWNVTNGEAAKPVIVEADSYITAIAFHPLQPSLLAGGTYNGEILIWNVSDGEAMKPLTSMGCVNSPREPVTRLQWLQNLREARDAHRFVLCSASGDGKIMFWTPNNKLSEALAGYEVQNKKHALVGVQSMSFVNATTTMGSSGHASVPGVENVMLLGLESGDVFRTKPGRSFTPSAAAQSGLGVLDIDHFEQHLGPVHSVDCSPFFRNLFLTCSSDGSIRLYSTLERQHLLALMPSLESKHYLYGAQFSSTRPSVIAAVSRSGHLHVFDLESSRTKPVATVEAGSDGAPALSLSFNRSDANFLATGDAKGHVKVWSLSSALAEPTDLERAAVREAATTTTTVQQQQQTQQAASTEGEGPGSKEGGGGSTQQQHQQHKDVVEFKAQRQLFGFAV